MAADGVHLLAGTLCSHPRAYQVKLGQLSEATDLVEHHLEQIDATGEEQCRAPLLLAYAVIQREKAEHDAALSTARSANAVARNQGAVLWQDWIDAQFLG